MSPFDYNIGDELTSVSQAKEEVIITYHNITYHNHITILVILLFELDYSDKEEVTRNIKQKIVWPNANKENWELMITNR